MVCMLNSLVSHLKLKMIIIITFLEIDVILNNRTVMGLIVFLQNSYAEILTPSNLECDCIWR